MAIVPPEEIPGIVTRPWTDEEIAAFEKAYDTAQEDTTSIEDSDAEKEAMRAWKINHPETTIKEQRRMLETGKIEQLPWMQDVGLSADNAPKINNVSGFGISFPEESQKGDTFLRVDIMPSQLYKYNGKKWIEVDKDISDSYTYDIAYIDYLIEKIESGEYDPELLTYSEREQIAHRLNKQNSTGV
jgi:hypothetical protein